MNWSKKKKKKRKYLSPLVQDAPSFKGEKNLAAN